MEKGLIMKNNNMLDMTKENPKRLIALFALPVFLSQLFQQLYNSVDSLIVGNFIGREALAAVSSSGSLIFLLTSFFTGTALGAGVLISKFFGAKDYESMRKAIHTNVLLGFLSGILLTVVGVLLTPTILKLMKTDPNVLPSSIIYFRNYFLGVSGIVMYNIFNGILQAVGNSKRPLYYLMFSSILNIVLDIVFIRFLHTGVGGAAIATTISQFCSAFLCFMHLRNKKNIYYISFKELKIDKTMLRGIIHYGIPTGIQNSVIGLANVIVQSSINLFGENAMAGCGAYFKIEGFVFLPITSFTMAITTFIGQNLGANEFERAKSGARFGILSSVILAEVVGITMFFFAPYLLRAFTQDKDVILIGVKQFHTEAFFYFLLAYSHSVASVCRGSGKAIVPMFIMLSVWCVLRVTYITIVIKFVANVGNIEDIRYIFYAYPLTWFVSSVIYAIYYYKSDWVHSFSKKSIDF